jgi:hypothetical protein
MNLCVTYEIEGPVVLEVTEEIRWQLSNNAPWGATKPYVDEVEKISLFLNQLNRVPDFEIGDCRLD